MYYLIITWDLYVKATLTSCPLYSRNVHLQPDNFDGSDKINDSAERECAMRLTRLLDVLVNVDVLFLILGLVVLQLGLAGFL